MLITEGKVHLILPEKTATKKAELFYNPQMKLHRDISVLLLRTLPQQALRIADPLAGSGIRSLRFLRELPKNKISYIAINDKNPNFRKYFRRNARLNSIKSSKKIVISTKDANEFLQQSDGFEYTDIDPFGSPNFLLDTAIKRLARNGILAITATDLAPLAGTSPKACLRKYWATPLRNELQHEIGLRILIRKTQLVGAQYDKALQPMLAYHHQHYHRVFFQCTKGKQACDAILAQHKYFLYCSSCLGRNVSSANKEMCGCGREYASAGPLWAGKLGDSPLILKMANSTDDDGLISFLRLLLEESHMPVVGFYDLHRIAERYKISIPTNKAVFTKLKKAGIKFSPTHFSQTGIKADILVNNFVKIIRTS